MYMVFRAGAGAVLATLLACDNPERPSFPGSIETDTTPPSIQFVTPPPSDTVFTSGTSVLIHFEVRDPSQVKTVTCDVTGAIGFSLPAYSPRDTMFTEMFSLPLTGGHTGKITVTVIAADSWDNTSSKTFAFVVK